MIFYKMIDCILVKRYSEIMTQNFLSFYKMPQTIKPYLTSTEKREKIRLYIIPKSKLIKIFLIH